MLIERGISYFGRTERQTCGQSKIEQIAGAAIVKGRAQPPRLVNDIVRMCLMTKVETFEVNLTRQEAVASSSTSSGSKINES